MALCDQTDLDVRSEFVHELVFGFLSDAEMFFQSQEVHVSIG